MSPFALSWSEAWECGGGERAYCGPLIATIERDGTDENPWAWQVSTACDEGWPLLRLGRGESVSADAAKLDAEAQLGTIALEMMTALGLPVAV